MSERPLTNLMQSYLHERLKGAAPMEAYRLVYGKTRSVTSNEAGRRCADLERDPRIRGPIDESVKKAQETAMFGASDLFKRWVDQINVNPNEIVQHRRVCCRYCHGVDFRYQWREQEYADAVERATKAGHPLPEALGGFGFNATLSPMPNCPQCDGEGVGSVRIADTRQLTPGARQMIKKIVQKADGSIEVEMHDAKRTEEMIAKTLGMFKETLDINALMGVIRGDVTDDERAVLEAALRQNLGLGK